MKNHTVEILKELVLKKKKIFSGQRCTQKLEVSGEITQGKIRIQTVTNFGLMGKETFLSKNLTWSQYFHLVCSRLTASWVKNYWEKNENEP